MKKNDVQKKAREHYSGVLDLRHGFVDMTHGAGGRATADLIASLFARYFSNPLLDEGHDGAVLPKLVQPPVVSCDAHVVRPLFFPGGDIGRLAVAGTVNDVAVCGATPKWLTASFILEEGLAFADLERIVRSMAETAKEAGVQIVTGDTKVVERGHGDGVFIATTGVGELLPHAHVSGKNAQVGDTVIITGTMGDHGMTLLAYREGLSMAAIGTELVSDCAPLVGVTSALLRALGAKVHVLRDPTRGGLATTLNEIACQSEVGIEIEERAIPISPGVQSLCELLGLDPLYVANEGKLIVIVPEEEAKAALALLRQNPLAAEAVAIGHVTTAHPGEVRMRTPLGGWRRVDWLNADPLPRIC